MISPEITIISEADESSLQIIEESSILEIDDNIVNSIIEINDSSAFIFNETETSVITEVSLRGLQGDSAYEIALKNGFSGTIEEWLASLKGENGTSSENSDSSFLPITETMVVSNLANISYSLEHAPRPNSLKMFLNGLKERTSSLVISGNIVNFSELELGIGDELTFDYMYQT